MLNHLRDGFRLLDTVVYPQRGLIVGPQGEVHVEPRFMAVLVCLAGHAGQVVARDQLVDEVWGRSAVTDDSINRAVSQLRA